MVKINFLKFRDKLGIVSGLVIKGGIGLIKSNVSIMELVLYLLVLCYH